MLDMTSTRRTTLFKIRAWTEVKMPVLSVALMDLQMSTLEAHAEIHEDFRIIGNGTFKPSFGEGNPPQTNQQQGNIPYISVWIHILDHHM